MKLKKIKIGKNVYVRKKIRTIKKYKKLTFIHCALINKMEKISEANITVNGYIKDIEEYEKTKNYIKNKLLSSYNYKNESNQVTSLETRLIIYNISKLN